MSQRAHPLVTRCLFNLLLPVPNMASVLSRKLKLFFFLQEAVNKGLTIFIFNHPRPNQPTGLTWPLKLKGSHIFGPKKKKITKSQKKKKKGTPLLFADRLGVMSSAEQMRENRKGAVPLHTVGVAWRRAWARLHGKGVLRHRHGAPALWLRSEV